MWIWYDLRLISSFISSSIFNSCHLLDQCLRFQPWITATLWRCLGCLGGQCVDGSNVYIYYIRYIHIHHTNRLIYQCKYAYLYHYWIYQIHTQLFLKDFGHFPVHNTGRNSLYQGAGPGWELQPLQPACQSVWGRNWWNWAAPICLKFGGWGKPRKLFVLFCFVCFVLLCFVLFCFVLFCFVCLFVCLFLLVDGLQRPSALRDAEKYCKPRMYVENVESISPITPYSVLSLLCPSASKGHLEDAKVSRVSLAEAEGHTEIRGGKPWQDWVFL